MADIGEEILPQLTHFFRQKQTILLSSVVFTVALLICIVSSIMLGIALMSSYFGGILFFHSVFSSTDSSPNFLFMLKRRKRIVSRSEMPRSCTICGDSRCRRHKADLNLYNLQPWAEIKVPQEVDEALEDFLNTTLDKYVYSWYRFINQPATCAGSEVTEDEHFVHELRLCLRFMIAILIRRSLKVDLTFLITDKLLKAGIQHLDCYLQTKRTAGSQIKMEDAVLNYFGSNLHTAVHSRQQELKYLRCLSQNLLPFLLPKKYWRCKSMCALLREIVSGSVLLPAMDAVADPYVVNNLLVLFFDKNPMVRYPESTSPLVELLANFVETRTPPSLTTLRLPLSPILNNQKLLYPFMQFMKEEAAINVLQFCLAVEDFNRQMLDPDLNNEQLQRLHKEARHLYEMYCAPEAVDRVQLDKNVVEELKKIVYGQADEVIKLRTTAPLYKAYDQAFYLLENTFCPLFHQSDDYFTLVCGSRLNDNNGRASASHTPSPKRGGTTPRSTRRELSTVEKIGHKIKGVFKPATVDGKIFHDDASVDVADAVFADSSKSDIDGAGGDVRARDMSAWRVFIPSVNTQIEENWKLCFVYNIEVQSIDVKNTANYDPDSQHWQVDRRYHEFYVLEAKLLEFHGDLGDAQLPPKKTLSSSKGFDFMEARRKKFEDFLQKLLGKPNFRNSELLYSFLTPSAEFSTTMLSDINLGKMIKTMPMKLLKEKGQHLEPFLQAFVQSTEAAKPRPSKLECRDINEVPESEFKRKVNSTVYQNNANREPDVRVREVGRPRNEINLDGIYDYILYVAIRVFDVSTWFLQLLMAVRIAIKNTFEAFILWYIDLKLEQALVPRRLVQLISLLKDVVFESNSVPPGNEQKAFIANQALASFREVIPDSLTRAVGSDRIQDGTQTIFNLLQYPRLNKQLSYTLLDIIATELFPELAWPSRPSRPSFSDPS